jgi:hypothetical protein
VADEAEQRRAASKVSKSVRRRGAPPSRDVAGLDGSHAEAPTCRSPLIRPAVCLVFQSCFPREISFPIQGAPSRSHRM